MDTDSTTFLEGPSIPQKAETAFFSARHLLAHRLFLGNYDERRYVNQINEYRDVIKIIPAEKEFISVLLKAKNNLIKNCGAKWVGITGPDTEDDFERHCLWVNLKNLPFGVYWFQIKQLKYENQEIILKLKCVREARSEAYGSMKNEEHIADTRNENAEAVEQNSGQSHDFDTKKCIKGIFKTIIQGCQSFNYDVTWNNFFSACKFMVAVMVVLISELSTCFKYFAEYSVLILNQMVILAEILSNVLMFAMDCCTRVTGMFMYILASAYNTRTTQDANNRTQPPQRPAVSCPNEYTFQVRPGPSRQKLPLLYKSENRE